MIFAITTLFSALSISCIAAYFSIIGLATIFPGSMMAVVSMGISLEVGKIIAALWLHKNWKTAPRAIKCYLMFAIFVLMAITSMGIFGFLSKSHIEHQQDAEKSRALSSQVDSKIERQRELIGRQKEMILQIEQSKSKKGSLSAENITIEQSKIKEINEDLDKNLKFDKDTISQFQSRLSILDKEINELKSKSGGLFSNKKQKIADLEEAQRPERLEIKTKIEKAEQNIQGQREAAAQLISSIRKKIEGYQQDGYADETSASQIEGFNLKIANAMSEIENLEMEKFKHNDGTMQLEAEIGPVKYVAELISDISGTAFDLSQAVRVVIIILIFVFDPLAILLVLAAHISLMKRFPKAQISDESIIIKQGELQKKLKDIEEQEILAEERKKDIDQEAKIIELKEDQVKKYQSDVSKYKDLARTSKLEFEKLKLSKEENLESINEINSLEIKKSQLTKDLQDLKNKKSQIILKEAQIKNDIEKLKGLIGKYDQNKNIIKSVQEQVAKAMEDSKAIKAKLKETKSLEQSIKDKETLIKELEDQIEDLILKNKEIKAEKKDQGENSVIVQIQTDGLFKAKIKSDIGGTHEFCRIKKFEEKELFDFRNISLEIDSLCPSRKGPLLLKVFNANIKKYLNAQLDNREYRKARPDYNFIP
jgi:chromosome segregation ATPase